MRPIVLTLMLVLLLTGSGEAGQATCPQYYVQSHKDDYRYASARIYADTEEEVGQCVLDLSFKDQIIYKWERLPVSRELRASVTKHGIELAKSYADRGNEVLRIMLRERAQP